MKINNNDGTNNKSMLISKLFTIFLIYDIGHTWVLYVIWAAYASLNINLLCNIREKNDFSSVDNTDQQKKN